MKGSPRIKGFHYSKSKTATRDPEMVCSMSTFWSKKAEVQRTEETCPRSPAGQHSSQLVSRTLPPLPSHMPHKQSECYLCAFLAGEARKCRHGQPNVASAMESKQCGNAQAWRSSSYLQCGVWGSSWFAGPFLQHL